MRILDIVAKDLRQIITDWRTPVLLVMMPIVGTIFFGIAFAESEEVDARVPVAVINRDSGMISAWITQAVGTSGAVSGRMSIFQPVRRAARRAFCPSRPIARDSW